MIKPNGEGAAKKPKNANANNAAARTSAKATANPSNFRNALVLLGTESSPPSPVGMEMGTNHVNLLFPWAYNLTLPYVIGGGERRRHEFASFGRRRKEGRTGVHVPTGVSGLAHQ